MATETISNLSQTKTEYTKILTDLLLNSYFDYFSEIYNKIKISYYSKDSKISEFRKNLENIPNWNSEQVNKESDKIIKKIKCDYLSDMITAVYLSYTKILTTINQNISKTKINLVIPKTENFIHKSYINVAREFWKNPLIFENSNYDNVKNIETLIKDAIEYTIRSSLPIKDILKSQLTKDKSKINSSDSDSEDLDDLETNNNDDYLDYDYKKYKDVKNKVMQELLNSKYNYVKSIQDEPTEREIIKNTENISVNDDILKEPVKEEIYDNPNIFDNNLKNDTNDTLNNIVNDTNDSIKTINTSVNSNLLNIDNNIFNTESEINESSQAKPNLVSTEPKQELAPSETNLLTEPKQELVPTETNISSQPEPEQETETKSKKDENTNQIIKLDELSSTNEDTLGDLPQKIITVDKKEDDTNTLDNFYNDLSFMTGVKSENNQTYTLFDN